MPLCSLAARQAWLQVWKPRFVCLLRVRGACACAACACLVSCMHPMLELVRVLSCVNET